MHLFKLFTKLVIFCRASTYSALQLAILRYIQKFQQIAKKNEYAEN